MGKIIIRPAGLVKVVLPITVVKPENAEAEIRAALRDRQFGWRREAGLGLF